MLALIFIVTFVAGATLIAVALDRLFWPVKARPLGSFLLLSVAIWVASFVLFTLIVQTPGASGPVQYAGSDWLANFIFRLRVGTIIAMLVTPIVSAVLGIIRLGRNAKLRSGAVIIAVATYLMAWAILLFKPGFFPSV
jgi:hypothetical protein